MPRSRTASCLLSLTFLSLLTGSVAAETGKSPAVKPLSIDWIMRGPDLYGTEPTNIRWSLDSKQVYFQWKEPKESRLEPVHWYVYTADAPKGTKPRRLSDDEAKRVPPPVDWSAPNTKRVNGVPSVVYERDGDLYRYDGSSSTPIRLTDTPTVREGAPRWGSRENAVIYRQENNLFYLASDGSVPLRQLTDIRSGPAPKDDAKPSEGVAQIAETIEKELFDTVRVRAEQREKAAQQRREAEAQRERVPFYLAERESVNDLVVSPDEGQVLALLSTSSPSVTPASIVPQYITDDGFVAGPKGRPNVGWEKGGSTRCVLLDVKNGNAIPVTVPAALSDRKLLFLEAKFAPKTGRLAVLARAQDFHDRWIFFVDTKTGSATIADAGHDDAWIDGPDWDAFGWTPDGDALYFVSESSGWARLAMVTADGTRRLLTNDHAESYATVLVPDNDSGWSFVFNSSQDDLSQLQVYRRSLTTNENVNLTKSLPGWNEATPSPDGKSLAIVHSYINTPPELFVMEAAPTATARQVTVSPAPEFLAYPWRAVPVVQIPARDGTPVYARLFTPTKRTRASGAAVVFVHGAGYLQNADKGWTEYPREYMFHHFLAERGYTVLDVDYRGSAGYGRDFRTGIYKHMGGKDLSDVTDAVRWLVRNQKIDSKRVGIYGGSYGGFLTLMALFTEPQTYRAGAALRPVTDWTKYNNGYTARILGLPQDDLAAYKRSSPIFFAEGLTGSLLMCHGMRDDNVFFQDTVRLTERLIELGKTDHFATAIYPVETHGFTEPASWTDEYKRIFSLFDSTIGIN